MKELLTFSLDIALRTTVQLTSREELHGKENPFTLDSMNDPVSVFGIHGKYEKAEARHQRMLELSQVVLGKEHSFTMNNLAGMLHR